MADEIYTLDAGGLQLSPGLLERVAKELRGLGVEGQYAIVSHPTQKETMIRQGLALIKRLHEEGPVDGFKLVMTGVPLSESKTGEHLEIKPDPWEGTSDWLESVDLPEDIVRIETSKGLAIIRNLATQL